jgi:glycosyltransferase involved in cell wall biosynthesis
VRGSRSESLVAAATATFHRARGTYRREVDCYVALTEFQRRLLVDGGLPAGKVRVVPNFLVEDPGVTDGDRDGVLFVGRLSAEKGIGPLIDAARKVPGRLTIIGDGPMRALVERAAEEGTVTYTGRLSKAAVLDALRRAVALLCPSIWFEGMPMVLLEAFATGTPVIASRIGSLEDLDDHGRIGLLTPPGDSAALAEAIRLALADPTAMRVMGHAARAQYEVEYVAERHLHQLLDTYASARSRGGTTN